MNPQSGTNLTEKIIPGSPGRLLLIIRKYRPAAWLVFLIISLVLLLAWMPSAMRVIIWQALVVRGVLSGMLLVFSLLAVSLVWSVGQRVDVWAFLVFNLRGARPAWLDWTMLGFTQVGSAIHSGVSNAMAGGGVGESAGAQVTPHLPGDPGAHCRPAGDWAIFPERAYQPGILHSHTAGPLFPCQHLGGIFIVCDFPDGGHHTHVRGCTLPTRRAGRGNPGQRLVSAGSAG